MSIGNILPDIRNKGSKHCYIIVAFLPIAAKYVDGHGETYDQSRLRNATNLRRIFNAIFKDIKSFDPDGPGIPMRCADGNTRRCYPILCCWMSDHEEHAKLHALKNTCCPLCKVPRERFEDHFSAAELESFLRSEAEAVDSFESGYRLHGQQNWESMFWGYPLCDAPKLHKPDPLHTNQLGMMKYEIDWIQDFLREFGRLTLFDKIWANTTTYPNFLRPAKKYREVSQWQGKEMMNLQRIVLPCFAAALTTPRSHTERTEFPRAIECIQHLSQFLMMSYYTSHDDRTVAGLQHELKMFHRTKDIFRKYRRTKRGNKTVRAQMADERHRVRIEFDSWRRGKSISQQNIRKMQDQRSLQELERQLYSEKGEFNFVKMHLLQHYALAITELGPLPYINTEPIESMHRRIVKEGYRSSNRNDSHLIQVFTRWNQYQSLCMREMRLSVSAQRERWSPSIIATIGCINPVDRRLLSKSNRAAHLRNNNPPALTYDSVELRPFFPDQVNSTRSPLRRALSPNTYTTVQDYQMPTFHPLSHPLKTYLARYYDDMFHPPNFSDNSVRNFRLMSYRTLHVPVYDDQAWDTSLYQLHKLRCTGDRPWFRREIRNDYCLFRRRPADQDPSSMIGLEVGQILGIFKVIDPTGAKHLVLLRPLRNCDGGSIKQFSRMCRVEEPQRADIDALMVPFKAVVSAVHLVPDRWVGERITRWYINTYVDRKLFLLIY